MIAPPLIAVVPGASVVTEVSAVVPPTTPPKVVVPPVLITKDFAPLTVLVRVVFPIPPAPELKRTSVVRVTPVKNPISPLAVVMLPPILFKPEPDCLNPVAPVVILLVVVNEPLFTKATYPPALMPELTVNAVPVKSTFSIVVTKPSKLVIPVPLDWVRLEAVNAGTVIFLALLTNTAPKGLLPPTTPSNKMFPADPAESARELGAVAPSLFNVPLKEMAAPTLDDPLLVVSTEVFPLRTVFPAKVIADPVLMKELLAAILPDAV